MKRLWKFLPWCFLALFGAEIVAVMVAPKKSSEYHVKEFGRLPVLLNGRVQPFDSVARNALLQIRSTGDLPLEQVPSWQFWRHPEKLRSSEWLLEVMTRPEVADTRNIFLIHHSDLLGELRLDGKGIEKSGLHYFTLNELKPVLGEISEQGRKASALKSEEQTAFQKQAVKLANALMLYQRLKVSLQPEGMDQFAMRLAEFEQNLPAAHQAAHDSESGNDVNEEAVRKVALPLQRFQLMAQYAYPSIVPPADPKANPEGWQNAGVSLVESFRDRQVNPAMKHLAAIATAYRHQQPSQFNRAVAEYKTWLEPRLEKELSKGRAEYYYNEIKAFLHATIIYICAFVLAVGSVLTLTAFPGASEALRRSAFYLIVLAGIVHTFGLIFRMALEGRPPVTNLYSSAIFIGWGAMVVGIILEYLYRVGIGSIVASFVGFVTLLIAHNLALGGDTMEMLRAVLDTNFWLATHVVVITLGYAANFAAGLLAILFIFLGLLTPLLGKGVRAGQNASPVLKNGPRSAVGPRAAAAVVAGPPDLRKSLDKMVYGIVCFATLFSFVGTVLGGIWADQSWGRFWGWDPKENGALLIVLWNAVLLHARWGGMVRERGFMNLAIFGNVITAFSWFGVNMLGIGLHSYGFMDAAFKWLMIFFATQFFFIALGLVPLQYWRSFRSAVPAPSPRPGRGTTPAPATT